jgi:hypothetical protein
LRAQRGSGLSTLIKTIEAAATPSVRTLHGLDWLNFFLADVQTGVGPFLAIYLAGYGWNEQRVGIALTVGASPVFSPRPQRVLWLTACIPNAR